MNLLSYCLFGNGLRYWNNLPFLLIANEITTARVIPNLVQRFYVAAECKENKLWPVLDQVACRTELVQVVVIDEPYKGFLPTTWRMKPLWDKDVDFFFCRDIDTAPYSHELRSMLVFLNSTYAIHAMRSHPLHNLLLMGGMCGFSVRKLWEIANLPATFEDYLLHSEGYGESTWTYGCDQALLHNFFVTGERSFLRTQILDHRLPNKIGEAPVLFSDCATLEQSVYDRESLIGADQDTLAFWDDLLNCAGQVISVQNIHTQSVISADSVIARELRRVFMLWPNIKRHYESVLEMAN